MNKNTYQSLKSRRNYAKIQTPLRCLQTLGRIISDQVFVLILAVIYDLKPQNSIYVTEFTNHEQRPRKDIPVSSISSTGFLICSINSISIFLCSARFSFVAILSALASNRFFSLSSIFRRFSNARTNAMCCLLRSLS